MLCLLVMVMMLATAQATNLIRNGDFETGALAPYWSTPLGTSFLAIVSDGRCHGGTYCCEFGRIGSDNSIVQSVLAVEGTTYTLSFWLYSDGLIPNDFSATAQFDGGLPVTQFTITNAGPSAPNFFFISTIIVSPPGPITTNIGLTITFAGRDDPGFLVLDDVVLEGIAGVVGDPQFVGLRGQSYQVHGIDGGIYNLVSSNHTQINARFVFLTEGQCPIIDGIPSKNCWSHPGSYLGAIGIQQIVDGKVHQLTIQPGSFQDGFSSIELNGSQLKLGSSFNDGSLFSVSYNSTHQISVQTEEFTFLFDNSDMFINQFVNSRVPLSSVTAHGLFGQTHVQKLYNTALKYIEGDVDDYLILENDLFGVSFVYNKFPL